MVEIRAMRKAKSTNSPVPDSPYMISALKHLRGQLDIVSKEEAKAEKTLTVCRNTRIRIEQALAALLGEECNSAPTVKNSSTEK